MTARRAKLFTTRRYEKEIVNEDSILLIFFFQIDDLERMLDAPLHVVYLKQLSLLRDKSLKTFKQALAAVDATEFEAMIQVSGSVH